MERVNGVAGPHTRAGRPLLVLADEWTASWTKSRKVASSGWPSSGTSGRLPRRRHVSSRRKNSGASSQAAAADRFGGQAPADWSGEAFSKEVRDESVEPLSMFDLSPVTASAEDVKLGLIQQ